MTPCDLYSIAKDAIASLGFPIFVAAYLLIYHRKALEETKTALQDLTIAINALNIKMSLPEK